MKRHLVSRVSPVHEDLFRPCDCSCRRPQSTLSSVVRNFLLLCFRLYYFSFMSVLCFLVVVLNVLPFCPSPILRVVSCDSPPCHQCTCFACFLSSHIETPSSPFHFFSGGSTLRRFSSFLFRSNFSLCFCDCIAYVPYPIFLVFNIFPFCPFSLFFPFPPVIFFPHVSPFKTSLRAAFNRRQRYGSGILISSSAGETSW